MIDRPQCWIHALHVHHVVEYVDPVVTFIDKNNIVNVEHDS